MWCGLVERLQSVEKTLEIKGLAKGKKALVISPSASDYTLGTAGASLDFCTCYVRAILGFIGIEGRQLCFRTESV